ncbi:hypothetical protein J4727_12695 [Providencia rettgeri]|uniref:Uncharacterized protein n=1 Tax=Providencia rettgeri TaxID=587 RepID=A0A939NAZ0_PRORE|nr:hypothetical protein [Providencia rettgeri]
MAELIALVHENCQMRPNFTQLISASELDENQSNKLIFKVLALLSSQSTSLTPSAAALLSQLKAQSEGGAILAIRLTSNAVCQAM